MAEPTQTDATPRDRAKKMALDEPLEDFLNSKAKSIDEDSTRSGTLAMLDRMCEDLDLGVAYRESEQVQS